MLALTIVLDGTRAWNDLAGREVIHVRDNAPPLQVAAMPGGMGSGLPSVAIRIELPDGRLVIAETSARLFCTAGRAIAAKFPELFKGEN